LMREPSKRERQAVLAEAFEQGVRHFDVARMYGLGVAEGELGTFARGRRDQMIIATKFGIEASAPGGLSRLQGPARSLLARYPALRNVVKRRSSAFHEPHRYDAATARTSLEKSLRELQTDYIDILLLHDPSATDEVDLPEISDYLEEARRAGHLRAWGVAGEQDRCIQLKRSLTEAAILQLRRDILSPHPSLTSELEPLITFGVLGEPMGRILAYLGTQPERRDQWSQSIGLDGASSDTIACLLLRDALRTNPHGVVLFSTTKPERLQVLASALSPEYNCDDRALGAFRQHVAAEISSQN
jgi:D-threo-aldose 1-dehydrogenase